MYEESESKLSLVVRKPQEGKTTICITSITNDRSRNIHIVVTMNTLASGMQFFGRLQDDIGPEKIVVFNSDKKTAGNCLYAKDVSGIVKYINTVPVKVIVCCAHSKRIRESLPDLFDLAADSLRITSLNIKFTIHVDEAHAYIPVYTKQIDGFNKSPIVSEIIGYTATPDGIWGSSRDPLFHKILIRDIETELSIMRSTKYFGVKDCEYSFYDSLDVDEIVQCIPEEIPEHILTRVNGKTEQPPKYWFGNNWCFDFGNERLQLGFLNHVLPLLRINPNQFSYHFAPAFARKATQYQSMEIILSHYPTANVIVLNGNGYEMFRSRFGRITKVVTGDSIRQMVDKRELAALREPSFMIQKLIQDTPNFPTFITGFHCVEMSVTLINPQIGNFDSVILSHEHCSRDKLYQLCRFLFNYERWPRESKIKKTHIHSLKADVVGICLDYERHIERITSDFAGKTCSLREINDLAPEEPTEREVRKKEFESIALVNSKLWKKFKVYEDNDEEEWEKANRFYESVLGKRINGRSMPKKPDGFYRCSDSKGLGVKTATTFNNLEKEKWSNRFQLKKDCLSYAHVFVGYENLDDPSEYTIFIKFAQLVDTPSTREHLAKWYDAKGDDSKSEDGN
jgi:hypothetical protein